ncbi:type I DNA topoisomerase [Candidatus Saccharibacteria bacterium]|nr:type I DNA topoisomerase [Candidatus Saccharibacteria bacterium]
MSYKLVIVESPTKVTSVGRYLRDGYKIASSMGHVRDLPAKGGMHIDIENDFQPHYEISPDKKKLIAELKKLAKDASEVIMASDEDREGEAIAWHLCHILGLKPAETKRIVFHEITEDALKAAIESPRFIDQNLVNAQQARRVLDRIVGFELSPILWRKVQKGLSAGRVQSVAVRLICEREEAIKDFEAAAECHGQAIFRIDDQEIKAELKNKFADLKAGRQFLQTCRLAKFSVADIKVKPSLRNPSAPFRTSTLQQEAARKFGFSVRQTMVAAQKLYEAGFITYMRTDSLNLSNQALESAKRYVSEEFGAKYHRLKRYQTKGQGAQEAHEAIRPTDFKTRRPAKLDAQAGKLYDLIWRRTLASQMAPAETDKTDVVVAVSGSDEVFLISGQILKFDGFLKATEETPSDVVLPELQLGQELELLEARVFEKFSSPPARYDEAGLVRQLEELGIGRPSTYAPTIGTILDRGYVVKGDVEAKTRRYRGVVLQKSQIEDYDSDEKWGGATNKLLPTSLAELVTPFLTKYFGEIMDYGFTSKIETDFDKIAQGELGWVQHLKDFYDRFHPLVESTQTVSRSEIGGMKELGRDPADQKVIYARLGRFGPMLQKGLAEDSEEKPVFASLPAGKTLDSVTLEDALKMFQLPRLVGQTPEGEDILAKIGRFGPYLQAGKLFVPLKDNDPFSVDLATAQELIKAKQEEESNRVLADFGKIKILNGRFGPYITDGSKNCRLPKTDDDGREVDATAVSQKQAAKWLAENGKPAKKSRRTSRR